MKTPRGRQHADQCLGDRAAALTDGELGTDARDAALAHLVHCDRCRDEVAGQRRLKARLAELADPQPPAGLLERLAAMDSSSTAGPGDGLVVLPTPVVAHRHRVSLPSVGHSRAHGRPRRGVRYAVVGGASMLALGVSAFALGGAPTAPTVVPQVDNFSMEHASTTGEIPFGAVAPQVSYRRALVGAQK